MNLTIAILGLAVLILLHEAGHFFVARAVGTENRQAHVPHTLQLPPANSLVHSGVLPVTACRRRVSLTCGAAARNFTMSLPAKTSNILR